MPITRKIVTGLILIIAVLIPSLNRELLASLKLKFIYKGNKKCRGIEYPNCRRNQSIETKFGKSETRYFSGAGRESSENGKNREEY